MNGLLQKLLRFTMFKTGTLHIEPLYKYLSLLQLNICKNFSFNT